MALSKKQQAFVEHYLTCWNATKAATLAGYSEKTARSQGSRLLTRVDIQSVVEARIEELTMSADEVLLRLSEQARAEYAQFFRLVETTANDAPVQVYEVTFDFEACKSEGKLHLIKKIKHDKDGRMEVEFYDAQTALVHIGRTHSLFRDRTDISLDGDAIRVVIDR